MGRRGGGGRAARVSVQRRLPSRHLVEERQPVWNGGESRPGPRVRPRGFLDGRVPRPGPGCPPRTGEGRAGHVAASPHPGVRPHLGEQRAGRWAPHVPQTQRPPAGFLAPTHPLTSPPVGSATSSLPPWAERSRPHRSCRSCRLWPPRRSAATGPRTPRATPCTTTDRTPDLGPPEVPATPGFP